MSERSLVFTSLRIDHLQSPPPRGLAVVDAPRQSATDRPSNVFEFLAVQSARSSGHEPEPKRGRENEMEDDCDDDEQATGTVRRRGEDRVQISDEEGEREDCRGEGDRHSERRNGDQGEPLRDPSAAVSPRFSPSGSKTPRHATHCDEDPDSRRVPVQADDLDWAAFARAGPVLDRDPHQYRQTQEVGVSVAHSRGQYKRRVLLLCARKRFGAHTTEVAAPRRVKSYEYGRPSR